MYGVGEVEKIKRRVRARWWSSSASASTSQVACEGEDTFALPLALFLASSLLCAAAAALAAFAAALMSMCILNSLNFHLASAA
jgi:hypothetical protein